ncbi:hypothetical protein L7F22_014502 [Adiantum nelumboides]|nr:hypothetical protein [Adiantum nelumboides]
MADNNKENRMSIDDFDFAHEDANDDTSMLVNYLVTRLHQAMGNPALQDEVQQQLHAYGILPLIQQERGPERFQGETSKIGLSTEKGVENPYQDLKQLLEGKPSSKKKGHAQHERSPSREREESESSDGSMEDVAPRRRRAQRSPTPTKRKTSPHSPHHTESKREEKNSKKRKERKRSPSSPSSLDEGSGYSSQERQRRGHRRSYAAWKRSSKLKKFKKRGKNISFLTYDGTFGATDKVLAFIQQFDAAFGDEGFTESSKLRHVAMHFQKSARQWWASLRANGEAPQTWKALRASIMKQFLASNAKDKVLTKWRSLKLSPYESIHKYVEKFWDLHLKADSPWESISMVDFIFGLPKSIHGNTRIWTIVDKFSKQAHFIPVKKTIKAHQMATLFISQVFKYHGLPTSIVSDRDPRMTNNFWKGLFENLGTRLNFSLAYHPQTDGQSEIANLMVLDLLKAFVTKVVQRSQWEKYLPLVEYAYNNTVHTSIGKAPFEVIEGIPKSPFLLKVHGKIFAANEYSRDLKESFQKIKDAISIAQQKQKATANKHRRALAFKEND